MDYKKVTNNQIERYPNYLRYLILKTNTNTKIITSREIAKDLKYSEESVRKDLQVISRDNGKPGLGRKVNDLIEDIENFLGYHITTTAIVIGVGNVGNGLISYDGFNKYAIKICGGFDTSPKNIGKEINGVKIYDISEVDNFIKKENIEVAILCVPSSEAQKVADIVVSAGIKAIYNFAPVYLVVKDDVIVDNIDIASSIAFLSAKIKMKKEEQNERSK